MHTGREITDPAVRELLAPFVPRPGVETVAWERSSWQEMTGAPPLGASPYVVRYTGRYGGERFFVFVELNVDQLHRPAARGEVFAAVREETLELLVGRARAQA